MTYTNWHTTALCSPTRSSLLTGRNHTTNGMACIAEATTGFPNSNGHSPFESATIAEVLGERGWNTYMLGKWHLVAADEMNMASTKRNWPVGRGFERYYGFLGGETNQWYPDLVYDNHYTEQPRLPSSAEEWAQGKADYHLTEDLTDKAIEFIRDAKMVAPDKPFFMYFCPGASHAPHHAPKEWIDKYQGKFDMGYDRYRELVSQRQLEMGIMPAGSELTPANPYAHETSPEGKPWNPVDVTRPWDSLPADEQRLFARMAEVSVDTPVAAGVLFSHGARFGGHSLYLKDGLLKYAYNFVGAFDQVVTSDVKVPTGKHILSAAFVRQGTDMPTHGTLTLYIDDQVVGSAEIKTQPGNFSLVGEGLNVGRDPGEPVTSDYAGRGDFAFTGGTIKQVIVDVSGEAYVDLEKEAVAMFARD